MAVCSDCRCDSFSLIGFIFLCLNPAVIFSQGPDAKCTRDTSGLPAQSFNQGLGTIWTDDTNGYATAWLFTEGSNPVVPFDTGYVYLDSKKSGDRPRRLEAGLSWSKAICIEFHYAVTGVLPIPLYLDLWHDQQYLQMHEFQAPQPYGAWGKTTLSCCLPSSWDGNEKLSLEATTEKESVVAIDYIEVRHSDMQCDNTSQPVCYLTSALDFTPKQKCTTSTIGLPVNDFNGGLSSWKEVTSGGEETAWVFTDGSSPFVPIQNGYIYLDDKKSNEQPRRLEATLSWAESICVDFYYAVTGTPTDPIRFYLWYGNQYLLMHEVLPTEQVDSWGQTTFECCVPSSSYGSKKLSLEATSRKDAIVAIDDINVRHSDMKCDDKSQLVCYPTPP